MAIAIKYLRMGTRELDGYVWDKSNNHIVEVDVEMAANLLSYPMPQFVLAPNAKATRKERADLAKLLGVSEAEVYAMFKSGEAMQPLPVLSDISGFSNERQAQFAADYNIDSVEALAKADPKVLIGKSGATAAEIKDWIQQAKNLLVGE